uniref:ribosomal protein S13 n=1 Tax=Suriana maritima TaxID=32256 RepID=UPI00279F13E2|nr:ribosomal protein S13 [Suriana maritima]WIL07927.1 ribosomal protein S13 [Suriana maritima]
MGPKKAIQVRYRLGIRGKIKIKEFKKYQIDQIEQMIGQDHVVHWELKRGERADIERFISISCYRGIRHKDGLPLPCLFGNELILMLGLVASRMPLDFSMV